MFICQKIRLVKKKVNKSYEPPWQQNIFSSKMAATGKVLKQSVKVFHSLMLYLRLPKPTKKNFSFFNFWMKMYLWAKSWVLEACQRPIFQKILFFRKMFCNFCLDFQMVGNYIFRSPKGIIQSLFVFVRKPQKKMLL